MEDSGNGLALNDEADFDLSFVRPAYTTKTRIITDILIVREAQQRLELLINRSFMERGMKLLPEYFSLPIWDSFQYLLVAEDLIKEKDAGVLLAFKPEDFVIIDKIAVPPEYRGRHIMSQLVRAARVHDVRTYGNIEAALRTSDRTANEKYKRVSDFSALLPQTKAHPRYWVHIFDSKSRNYAADPKIRRIVAYLGNTPSSFESVGTNQPQHLLTT
ncbi:GNAT family N-acetyltransferase [Candidatus Woesearchaeota archaeon]|nr:GNAT family N-acetyltransferase [Candidatus Woesearchaeota archaeon]